MILAGVDIETTGLDLNANHRLIQIGICVKDTETGQVNCYTKDVKPIGDMQIQARALEINKFDLQRIGSAHAGPLVDGGLATELKWDGYTPHSLIPVGWNIGLFDLPFIRHELPAVARLFKFNSSESSPRLIDLTALGLLYEYKTGTPYAEVKTRIKEHCIKTLGRDQEHDALYDAQAALVALDWFRDELGNI